MFDRTLDDWIRPSRRALRELRHAVRRAMIRARRRKQGRVPRDVADRWERLTLRLLRFGGASAGNTVRFFTDGDAMFERLWEAMGAAKQRIWCETYILEPDRIGTRTIAALAEAAARGCEVLLIYDYLGSPRAGDALLAPLRAAGGRALAFNPPWPWQRRGPLLCRDHRKIVVIDDRIGFCGGMNWSEDYAGPRHGNGRFQDCHLELRGPCARDLAQVFLRSLRTLEQWRRRSRRTPRPRRRRLSRPRRTRQATFVQVLGSSGRRGRRAVQRSVRMIVNGAGQTCYITTPYFVPSWSLRRAMWRAARRGVEVRVLTAGLSDVPLVRLAAQHIYGSFLRHGVRIHELHDRTLHAKTLVVDGLYATVGSFNLDQWSDRRNLEVNVGLLDAAAARELHEQFVQNLARAREVHLSDWSRRSWPTRLLHWLAYLVARL
jgi:cardiolipin synthase